MANFDKVSSRTGETVSQRGAVSPRVDVYENERELLVIADVPGAPRDGLTISVDKDELTIEARAPEAATGRSALLTEYRATDYRRTFVLPGGIDREHIDAELKAGVLTLKLPKLEALRPRRIQIRTA